MMSKSIEENMGKDRYDEIFELMLEFDDAEDFFDWSEAQDDADLIGQALVELLPEQYSPAQRSKQNS